MAVEVEYKDTFTFKLFPEYTYTVPQQHRLRLFQGRLNHWKKAVNYADRFSGGDQINLLYMMGYHPGMKAYVERTKTNVVILCAKFTPEDLKIYDRYQALIKDMKQRGLICKEGSIVSWYYTNREVVRACRSKDDIAADRAQVYDEEAKIMSEYEALVKRSVKYFERYTIIDKLHPEKTISHNDLDRIIKRYFPRGREQFGLSDRAYHGVKTIDYAFDLGLKQEDCRKLLGISSDIPSCKLFKDSIKRCQMNINVALRVDGWVDLNQIFLDMQKPPYGWSFLDPHSAYCFGYALSEYLETAYYWDRCTILPLKENTLGRIYPIIDDLSTWGPRQNMKCILSIESGWHLVDRLAYIFNVEKAHPALRMIQEIRPLIEVNTRYPVSLIDETLASLFICDSGLVGSGEVKSFVKYLTWDRCETLREQFSHINEIVLDMVRKRFPDITDEILYQSTTQSSGWLWRPETFWRSVEIQYSKAKQEGISQSSGRKHLSEVL